MNEAELRRGIGLRHPARRALPAPHRARQHRHRAAPARLGQGEDPARARASCSSASGWRPSSASATRPSSPAGSSSGSGVARALAADPPVMLMDEPFSAVDPVVREQLQDEFLRLQAELGKTIVFVTHDIDEAIKLGDQVAVLRVGGRLAQVAEPAYLLAHPADDFVADFVGRDRGYRALGFQEAPRLPLRSEPTVVLGETSRPRGCRVAPRGRRRPASAGLGRAGRIGDRAGRPRPTCTAAAQWPANTVLCEARSTPRCRRRVVAASSSTTAGCCAARCRRTRCSRPSSTSERPERDESDPVHGGAAAVRGDEDTAVTWLADNWQLGARPRRAAASTSRVSRSSSGSSCRSRLGWAASRWSRVLPGDHHHDRAALHDPVAGAVRHHADRAGHQDPRPGQRHRRA